MASVYEPGVDRGLGQLASHCWESYHLEWERKMGMVDMSDQCFDEIVPEKDPSMLAAFLNSTLFGARKDDKGAWPLNPKRCRPTFVLCP